MLRPLIIILILFNSVAVIAQKDSMTHKPLRVAVVGLVHDHVNWILGRENRGDIEIVGIAEPNRSLAEKYSKKAWLQYEYCIQHTRGNDREDKA